MAAVDEKQDKAPALAKLGALKDRLEAERAEIFPRWKAALDEAKGNIAHAAAAFGFEPTGAATGGVREQGQWLTKRLELNEYAAGLRAKNSANGSSRGRPPGTVGKRRKQTSKKSLIGRGSLPIKES